MKFKRENKGFSLVELIVVIAIFSVVGVVVGGFLYTASRSYSISANELTLQEEAQLVANQMQEMVLDTSYGISYQFVATDATGAQLIKFMKNDADVMPAGDLGQKDVFIYGKDHYYHLFWKKDTSNLYMREYAKNAAGNYVPVAGMPAGDEGVLFGEGISDFQVDLSKVASDRLVSFNIKFTRGGNREYLVTRTVSLRNNVLVNKTETDVYAAAGIEFQPAATSMKFESHTISPLWPGETHQYTVTVLCSKGGVPSQDVNWSVTSADGIPLDGETKVTSGNLLKISSAEKSSKIEVMATKEGYDFGTNSEVTLTDGPATVLIRQIQNLRIGTNDFETDPISPNGVYDIEVTMEGENLPGTVTDAGGIVAQFVKGGEFAEIESMTIDDLKASFKIRLKDSIPQNAEIGLSFRPARAEFSHIRRDTPIYKINSDNPIIFKIDGDKSYEWSRLGEEKIQIEFVSGSIADSYCKDDGTLDEEFYICYTYRVFDSDYNLVRTATSTVGTGMSDESVTTDYFSTIVKDGSLYAMKACLSDAVFLQSGTVVVHADLRHNTSGSEVIVGSSDNLTYFIPEATISYKRAAGDTGVSNMKSYITSSEKAAPIYINFTSGFANSGYKVALGNAVCTNTEFGNINASQSDITKNKITVVGNADAEYKASAGNAIEFSYGGLPNTVSVILTTPNVTGTGFYVPLNTSEWTKTGSTTKDEDVYDTYVYYVDDSHMMNIEYLNGKFNKASFHSEINMEWTETAYTMNKINKRWDIAIPE